MSKCLVTKLSGSSSNTALLKVGEMRIKFDKVSVPTLGTQGFGLSVNKPVTLQIIGDGYFTDDSFSENKGNTLILNPTDNHFVVSENTSEVAILDKYSLIRMRLDLDNFVNSAYYGNNRHLSIEDIKYSTGLIYVHLSTAQVTGDISSLKNLTRLTILSFSYTKVTGDIGSLKNLTQVKNLYFINCVLTGDLATLPANCKYMVSGGDSVFTWSTRPSSSNIVAISGSFKVINLDKMLQDLAQCKVGFTENDAIGYKNIVVKGTRTSASDAAVSTLQSKGYTVTIIPG